MEYMILIFSDERAWASFDEAALKAEYAKYMDYTKELLTAGVLRVGSPTCCEGPAARPRRSSSTARRSRAP